MKGFLRELGWATVLLVVMLGITIVYSAANNSYTNVSFEAITHSLSIMVHIVTKK